MRVKCKIRKHAKHFCVCVCPKHENMSGCSTKLGCKPGIFVVFSVVFSTCFLGTTPRVKHPIGNENPKWHESGFKASFYSRVPNSEVYRKADSPEKPSTTLLYQQYKTTVQLFQSPQTDPMHSVVFTGALKDRILHQGRRRGMQFPYWIEVQTKLKLPGMLESHRNPPNRTTLEVRLSTEKVAEIVFRVGAKARTHRARRASLKKNLF